MKVLLLTSEEWNDKKYGNNNMSNWFSGFEELDIAHVYCSGGKPDNRCCTRYFQISDNAMGKGFFIRKPAGRAFDWAPEEGGVNASGGGKKIPWIMKTELVRGFRDIVWRYGKINRAKLKEFIEEFQPDIIFSQRKASIRICRVEREVHKLIPDVPMIVYTADDEYSLKQFSLNPIFWWRRFAVRSYMRKNVKFYAKYYTDAEAQGEEYERLFGIKTDFLAKCGDFDLEKTHKEVHTPIRFVYTGKLYCNRWKTLQLLAKAIAKVNGEECKFKLDIYTQSPYKKKYRKWLDNKTHSEIKGKIPSEEVPRVYEEADIALHVEGFDLKNRLMTRYSFSTKIIDCMATGCVVMAICHESQNGLQYLRKHDAAITVSNKKEIVATLQDLYEQPSKITDYGRRAIECGLKNHTRVSIQKQLLEDMRSLTEKQGENNENCANKCRLRRGKYG